MGGGGAAWDVGMETAGVGVAAGDEASKAEGISRRLNMYTVSPFSSESGRCLKGGIVEPGDVA